MSLIQELLRSLKLRDLKEAQRPNAGDRNLLASILVPEVLSAVKDWLKTEGINATLIGGVALSYYVRPRTTTDFDLLFLSKDHIPKEVRHFKSHRKGAFEHKRTGVEAEALSPESINMSASVAKVIFETAITDSGMKIASPSGLIASKLKRFSLQDKADIVELYKHYKINLEPFPLPNELLEKYNKLIADET